MCVESSERTGIVPDLAIPVRSEDSTHTTWLLTPSSSGVQADQKGRESVICSSTGEQRLLIRMALPFACHEFTSKVARETPKSAIVGTCFRGLIVVLI